MKKIGILYISTGKYTVFWKDFFSTAEQFFLSEGDYEKHYFVFTDAETIENQGNPRIHKVNQEALGWPYITLDRFTIFQKARPAIDEMDYLYFFNGNMLFVDVVGADILPSLTFPLVLVKHPGFYNKDRSQFTYESDSRSSAAINNEEGQFYFMGGLNGGITSAYLRMVEYLERQVELDKKNGVMAIWHDESHLNRYAIDHANLIKVLEPIYGYPEGWDMPFEPKIIIRDKARHGGHDFLRNEKNGLLKKIRNFFKW
jgi:hypothetical protein